MSTTAELLHRAVALLRAGDHAGAEALLRPLCAGDAANPDALQLLALARARAGDFAGATRLFENYLERVPDNAGVWNNFANHLKRNDPVRAEQCYRRALALVPQHVDALYGLALLLVEQSRATEALDGERRLANLLHLGEQIHHAAATHESPDALLRWLGTSAAMAWPTRSHSCAWNRTATSSRSSPSTRRRAWSSASCSARSCGMVARTPGPTRPTGASTTTGTATRLSIFVPTRKSARRRTTRSGPRSRSRTPRSRCASSMWRSRARSIDATSSAAPT